VIETKRDRRSLEPYADEYVVYGGELSLFTRKLEAAMRFYRAPFRMESKAPEISESLEMRANTHQIPVLHTPEDWVIADTTPLLGLLDARFPARRLYPAGPTGIAVAVVEEVLDEWIARTMVHYRWHYEENAHDAAQRMTGRSMSREEAKNFPVALWGLRACRATGTESEHQQREVEREYLALMDALETQLGESRFALGDRPTAADAILLGGLRAHTNADPIPDLSGFARVIAWDAREADAASAASPQQAPIPFPELTPFGEHVLALGREQYAPFLLGNAAALRDGAKAFTTTTYGEETSYLARPYPERSRRLLMSRIRNEMPAGERTEVERWLERHGLTECFMPDAPRGMATR
jgi:glutathione S-transferase